MQTNRRGFLKKAFQLGGISALFSLGVSTSEAKMIIKKMTASSVNYPDILVHWGAEKSFDLDKAQSTYTKLVETLDFQTSDKLAGSYSAVYGAAGDYAKWSTTNADFYDVAEGRFGLWIEPGSTITNGDTYLQLSTSSSNYIRVGAYTDGGIIVTCNGYYRRKDNVLSANTPIFIEVSWGSTGISLYADGAEITGTTDVGTYSQMSTGATHYIYLGSSQSGANIPVGCAYDQLIISNDPTRDIYNINTVTDFS